MSTAEARSKNAVNGNAGAAGKAIALRTFAGPSSYAHQLDNIRVAHLTDQHVGRVTPLAVQQAAVDLANAQTPDIVVITGDFVCHSQLYLDQLREVIEAVEAPVFAVLGNHDHWAGAGEVRNALRRSGAEVLDNAHTRIQVRHQALQIVGLDDAYTGHADREKACKGLRADLPTLALSHIAEEAEGLWHEGAAMVLSGHTHAGQVTVARLHELAIGKLAGHRYVHGLYGSRGADAAGALYVGAGIGAAVIPLRVGERGKREVAVFELGTAPGSFDEHHREQEPLTGRAPSEKLVERRRQRVEAARRRRKKRG